MIDLNHVPNNLFHKLRKDLGNGQIVPNPRTFKSALFKMQLEAMKYVSEQQQNHCFLYGLRTQRVMMVDLLVNNFLLFVDQFCSSGFLRNNMFESDPWVFYRSKTYRINWQREKILSDMNALWIVTNLLEEYNYEEQTT